MRRTEELSREAEKLHQEILRHEQELQRMRNDTLHRHTMPPPQPQPVTRRYNQPPPAPVPPPTYYPPQPPHQAQVDTAMLALMQGMINGPQPAQQLSTLMEAATTLGMPGYSGQHVVNPNFVKVQLNGASDMGSEWQLKLDAKAATVDLGRVGHISLTKPKYISPDLMATYVKYGVSQALFDNITNGEAGACVREFFPYHDFLDLNGDQIDDLDWVQPSQNSGYLQNGGSRRLGVSHTMYQTGRNSNNDRKCYFFYGFKNLKYEGIPRKKGEVGGVVRAYGGDAELYIHRIEMWRGNVRLQDVSDTSLLNDTGVIFFQRPVIGKRCDDIVIRSWLRHNAMGHQDHLRPLGFVVEALGSMRTG